MINLRGMGTVTCRSTKACDGYDAMDARRAIELLFALLTVLLRWQGVTTCT
jgi:hypothetical protein